MKSEVKTCAYCDQDKAYCRQHSRWIICPVCKGEGTKDHPSFSNGITASEADELGEEFMESYMAGEMDVKCDYCDGSGKVLTCPEIEAALQAQYEMDSVSAAEAAMGA